MFDTLDKLKIITSKEAEKFSDLIKKDATVINAALYMPVKYQTAAQVSSLDEIPVGSEIAVKVIISRNMGEAKFDRSNRFAKSRVKNIYCQTTEGTPICLVFFKMYPSQEAVFAEGRILNLQGKIEEQMGQYRMVHPKIVNRDVEKLEIINKSNNISKKEQNIEQNIDVPQDVTNIEAIYGLNANFTQRKIAKIVNEALKILQQNTPNLTSDNMAKNIALPGFFESLYKLHYPENPSDVSLESKYRKRVALEELLAAQLALRLARRGVVNSGRSIIGDGTLVAKIKANLPFSLTPSQEDVLREITIDQASDKKMFRLLQGDVGSGKTIVSLIAAINAVECGMSAAIMAPTTILASQHYKFMSDITFGMGIEVALITSKTSAKERKRILNGIACGEINIIVGTHSLIQGDVDLSKFGLFVVDEQHRFGVKQRSTLFEKSIHGDILMMTATPIPRTMAMMSYGDIDVSIIKHKPQNRIEIDTRILSMAKYSDVIESFAKALNAGEKIYWICQMIEESDDSDLASAIGRFNDLKQRFGETVGLMHGKMKEQEKAEIMQKFLVGEYKILVATTVVEVGVNVPDATIIAIEQAERFGLSQLHQLRGRVGRSDKKSYCILLYSVNATEQAKERLQVIKGTTDGFAIAAADMEARGGGNLVGVEQSGFADFTVANPFIDKDLIQIAVQEAKRIIVSYHIQELHNEIIQIIKMFGYTQEAEKLLQN